MNDATPHDWVPGFVARHRERFAPHDWPAEDSDEYLNLLSDWLDAFRGGGVTEDEANRASKRLTLSPPQWRRMHLPAVVETVKTMRAERAPAAEACSTRDAAASLSRGCPRCDGQGLLTVVTTAVRNGEELEYTCGAHCTCPLGRFMRNALAANREGEHLLRRIPDLARLPWGWRELHEPEPAGVAR